MNRFASWRVLAPIDARNIGRDPLLRWLIFYPLAVTLLFRLGIGPVTERLRTNWDFDLVPYYPLCLSFLVIMTPMLAGMVIGFLLLDQRDDQTLSALQVTPLGLDGYLLYRMAVPVALSAVVTFLVLPGSGLPGPGLLQVMLAGLVAAPLAPIYALTLAGLASDKVQGFALAKALGVFLLPPVAAYLVQPPWQWLFGIVPLYWPAKYVWESLEGNPFALVYGLIGVLYQMFLLILLLRRLRRFLY